jgi:hypothetical protein
MTTINDLDAQLIDKIEAFTAFRMSNAVYNNLTTPERSLLMMNYRLIALDDPDFNGFWLLVPKGGNTAGYVDWFGEGEEDDVDN